MATTTTKRKRKRPRVLRYDCALYTIEVKAATVRIGCRTFDRHDVLTRGPVWMENEILRTHSSQAGRGYGQLLYTLSVLFSARGGAR